MDTQDSSIGSWFDHIWTRAKDRLRGDMEGARFAYWISSLRIVFADEERVVIQCRTPIVRDLTAAKYGKRIADAIAEFMATLKSVDFVADPLKPAAIATPPAVKREEITPPPEATTPTAGPEAMPATDVPEALAGKMRIKIEDIKRHVAEHYRTTTANLESQSRKREIVKPRQVAMFLSRRLSGRSYPEIARRFGGRDHTTVLHGCVKIARQCEIDAAIAAEVEGLMKAILEQSARERN